MVLFFKVIYGLVPTYLSPLLPDMREQRCKLRKTNSIVAPKYRTDVLKNSFFPHCNHEWNNLSLEFRKVKSLSLFRTRLISLLGPVKGQLFGIHDLPGVRRLTQLRLGLCPLRKHRLRHNFLDTNYQCACHTTVLKTLSIICCSARSTLSTELSSLVKLPHLPILRS